MKENIIICRVYFCLTLKSKERITLENKLEKRYGLFTAVCMVVGIVIGSGVFFKAQDILNYTDGNMPLGILAWLIGGAVMIICALTFSNLASQYEKVNGVVDYAEATVGGKYAYFVGWFMTTIYYPGMTSVLAWVSARYTLALFGSEDMTGGLCMTLAALYLCLSYALNALSPRLAGKFQVSSTVIKLIPLVFMAVVGTVAGFFNGNMGTAFGTWNKFTSGSGFSSIFAAVVATAFAYEGWIIATSINAELKNAKRNLPIALTVGSIIIISVYIFYYIGLAGAASVDVLRHEGSTAAFIGIFGRVAGNILNTFIVVSCLGTLNGLMLGCTRGMYSIAVRGHGPAAPTLIQVDQKTKMPSNSAVCALIYCSLWLFYFYGANLTKPIFGIFSFDSSELPIITIYAFYIPIFVMYIVRMGKENIFKNIVMPVLSVISCLFMIFAAIYAHGIAPYMKAAENGEFSFPVLFYLIVFTVIMLIGAALYNGFPKRKKVSAEKE